MFSCCCIFFCSCCFFFKQKTAYEIGLGIPAVPLFRSLWFVLISLLNVTLIILTLSVSRLLNLLFRLVAFLLFLNPQCLACGISTLSQSPMLGLDRKSVV